MRTDITYVILVPDQEEPVGYIRSTGEPTLEAMADHLAILGGFHSVDHFLSVNAGVSLGCSPLH
jgi:hypothetical protein